MQKMKFRIIKENTQDYWLELEGTDGSAEIKNDKEIPIWNIYVVCKWDGCVDYRTYSNGYDWKHECGNDCQCCEDYIHICSVDNHIEQMQTIKNICKEFFKDKSGEENWK